MLLNKYQNKSVCPENKHKNLLQEQDKKIKRLSVS